MMLWIELELLELLKLRIVRVFRKVTRRDRQAARVH